MLQNYSFETPDSALAAYLLSEGYPEPTIHMERGQCVFCFQDEDNSLQPFVRAYQSGKATGNIVIFYRNYKRVLRRVHDESR